MLNMYTGTVGSGKSIHALEDGLQKLLEGGYVVANFPIKPQKRYLLKRLKEKDEIRMKRWLFWDEITPEKLIALSLEKGWYGKESQCLVIIDEAGIQFNSREWQVAGSSRTKWIKFGSQSRKFGYDFIFVVQSDRMIDKQIRGLIEYEVKHYKLNNSFFLSWLKWFKVTMFLHNWKWYHTKVKGKIKVSKFKMSIAERYDTMRTFDLDELVENIEKMYSGSIIPAPVLIQISAWRDEIEARKAERKKIASGFYGESVEDGEPEGLGVPTVDDLTDHPEEHKEFEEIYNKYA